ncbi:N-acetyllactosaminide beta-1,6-N-acetylglucosaminyl-transferase-like [Anneissia japonica]|uniref:N-acetyllactosaminide beta-1,6-N-acetylglucosaminyl-transferase-like n=1 Tax=Anneissia japonica TaxID=1529436 RepID=UPI0014257776|nr:N-acetyllactosaminide beta-1,6-N-acetylglucosaminyl-transferase-like [Anneissia japonica]XP_033096125.1 N-acetyllactosaminide beta-1,6-N-acetylglucosaminyl-transferase-like [Anneissia japonica]
MSLRRRIIYFTALLSSIFIFVQAILFYISITKSESTSGIKRQLFEQPHVASNFLKNSINNKTALKERERKLTINGKPKKSVVGKYSKTLQNWPDVSDIGGDSRIQYHISGSEFHKRWDVNCTKIINGEQPYVHDVYAMLEDHRDIEKNLPVPDDIDVLSWMADCDEYKARRKYPTKPFSKEEGDFPLAYIIVTHKESAQLERLLRAIYHPQNVYCVHPDAKSPHAFHSVVHKLSECFDNVFVASKLESVQYAGYTRLLADINCMDDLLRRPEPWKYAMNMCAQDFPLKTNLEIVQQLKMYKGHNDINGILPPRYIQSRTRFIYRTTLTGKLTSTAKRKTNPPHGLTIYFGNAYYAATRRFVNYIINDQVAIDLLRWSNDTYSPDEHYWVTLQRDKRTPGGYPNATWDENVRFMKWGDIPKHPPCKGKYVRGLCVFGVGYMEYLTRQPHLLANKFYYSFDPITLQCIEELLDYRTAYPETVNIFQNFPITDMVWQNHIAF